MSYTENKNRKVFNIDFDGTLTDGQYTDNPTPCVEMIDKVEELYMSGNIIIIWTARQWNEAAWLVGWLISNEVPFHGIMMGKGGSDTYIDDKMMDIKEFLK